MRHHSACTTILVGKKASIDGSTMIARNDDTFRPITPQKFIIEPARTNDKGKILKSWLNKFSMELPPDADRVPAVPNVDYKKCGYYDESGINQHNVCMSCTESTYGNSLTLAFDPLVRDGLDEDCMQTAVLPYITSARHGVEYLGSLIKKYGSPAGNSVLFSDKDDIWYMEIVTGHHWVAQRIPDDCYAVAPNCVSIECVDFDDPDNFMYSEGIREFVDAHRLNPDRSCWNVRHIFGTATDEDRHYNTSRAWYVQKYLNPERAQDPEDFNLPFISRAQKLITREDIQFLLGSHYQNTPYDPLGHGADADKHKFRPIGLNRTQNAHILQIRNDVAGDRAAIMWLCIGGPTFTPFIPFFTNMNDTDTSFKNTSMTYNARDAWWYYKSLAALVESHYAHFALPNAAYLDELNRWYRARVEEIIEQSRNLTGDELTAFLTKENQKTVAHTRKESEKHMGELYTQAILLSKLTFKMDANL